MIISTASIFKVVGLLVGAALLIYIFVVGFKENSKEHGNSGSSKSSSSTTTQSTTEKKE